ncbi:MAG TPA: 50S ribosomal protein L7Ae-like protein [Firmicutes bacterium]|nr:50S ribosomal protein L7Ae-like protein [Bacillota bacterium]
MSYEELRTAKRKAVGTKETLKALERGDVKTVFVAGDAEEHVVKNVKSLCKTKGVPIVNIDTMMQLGKACGIEVGAAAAAILQD